MSWNNDPVTYTISRPGEGGDSLKVVVSGETLERLEVALGLIENRYTGYKLDKTDSGLPRMIFMIYSIDKEDEAFPFPTPLDAKTVARLAFQWIESLAREDYGKSPNIDGTIKRGWLVVSDPVGAGWSAAASIEPNWMIYSK